LSLRPERARFSTAGGVARFPASPRGIAVRVCTFHNPEHEAEETTNLAGRHPDKVAELKDHLASIVERGRSTPGPAVNNDVPVQWRETN
jgi:hypothetical protein